MTVSTTTNVSETVRRRTSSNREGKPTTTGTETERFEFARKHILTSQKLETKVSETQHAVYAWKYLDEYGRRRRDTYGFDKPARKPRTPEEREEIKKLEAAVVDARARLLLHENDGAKL